MVLIKVTVFAILATATFAAPLEEAQSYSSYSSGPLGSHDSLSLAQAPIAYSHAPVAISHAPVAISHAPVAIAHAPVAISHAPVQLHEAPEVQHYAPAHYEFKYGVRDEHTHDIKEQAEKRIGDKVEGYYKLVEPDGTTRTVHYTADKHTGFNAVVTKSGHASHPAVPVKVAVPVHKVVAAPVISYAHSAPVISYSHAPVASLAPSHSLAGSATSYSTISGSLGQESGSYH